MANYLFAGGGLLAAIVTLVVIVLPDRSAINLGQVPSQETLDQRLDELSKSMRNSARLVEQVSAELEARAAAARTLEEEAKAAEALAALNKDQADAVRRLLGAELAGAGKRIRRDSIVIGLASFVAGGGVTYLISLLVHPVG